MSRTLICAFNKSIQRELEERLASPPDRDRVWSPQQEAIFQAIQEPGDLVVIARAGTGKTTTLIEAVRRLPGEAEALTLHSAGFRLLQSKVGKLKVAKDEEFEELKNIVELYIEAQDGAIDGAMIKFLQNNGVVARIQKIIGWVKGTDPLFRKLEPFVQAAEQLAADLDPPQGQEQEAMLALAKVAMKSCMLREKNFREGKQRWATFDDMVWAPVRLFHNQQ